MFSQNEKMQKKTQQKHKLLTKPHILAIIKVFLKNFHELRFAILNYEISRSFRLKQ